MYLKYEKIIEYIVSEGKNLVSASKNIPSTERATFFKEADLRIERGLKTIIKNFGEDHELFSEEENLLFKKSKNMWVADPISGTQSFLNGLPHYCLVIAHLVDNEIKFACVYDPSSDDLFTAYLGKGSFLNGEQIFVSKEKRKVVVRGVTHYQDADLVERILLSTQKKFEVEKSYYSYAFDYCLVARGLIDGVISLTKDSFPEFAGSLIVREAGGIFTNKNGDEKIKETDRIFVIGNKDTYLELLDIISDPHTLV